MTIKHTLDTLQTGALRLPCLFACVNGTLLAGEGVFRTIVTALKFFGLNGESEFVKFFSEKTPTIAVQVMRPYKDIPAQQLAISAFVCVVIGNLGAELIYWGLGKPPEIYNKILVWLGPIRLDTEHHHPIVQAAIDWYNKTPSKKTT